MAADSQVFTLIARRPIILYASVPLFLFSGSIPVIWRQSENLRCAAFFLFAVKVRRPVKGPCPLVQSCWPRKPLNVNISKQDSGGLVRPQHFVPGFQIKIGPSCSSAFFLTHFHRFFQAPNINPESAFSSLSREGVLHSAENEGV